VTGPHRFYPQGRVDIPNQLRTADIEELDVVFMTFNQVTLHFPEGACLTRVIRSIQSLPSVHYRVPAMSGNIDSCCSTRLLWRPASTSLSVVIRPPRTRDSLALTATFSPTKSTHF
jgi:hypothetical protein